VESSCEFGIEPSGSIMLGNYRVSKQLGISRVVLSSKQLVSYRIQQRMGKGYVSYWLQCQDTWGSDASIDMLGKDPLQMST
jgi:hypothetical protein